MKDRPTLLSLLSCAMFLGCESDSNPSDTSVADDSTLDTWVDQDADVLDSAPDTGDLPAEEEALDESEWVVVTTTGARAFFFDFDQESNYISCLVMDGFTFVINASDSAGGDQRFELIYDGYFGPDTYDFTYSSSDPFHRRVSVRDGEYNYEYFYDFSRIDFHEEYSHCQLVVADDPTGPAGYMTGSLICEDLWAGVTSPDHVDDPLEFLPSVDLSVTFRCDVG